MDLLNDHKISPLLVSIFFKASVAWAVWNPYWLKAAQSNGTIKLSGTKAWTVGIRAAVDMAQTS